MSEYITLIHAQWRNTWKIFAAVMGSVVVFNLVFYLSTPAYELGTREEMIVGIALGVLIIAQTFWVVHLLLFQDGDGRLTLEMPEYLLQLPISSWKLAAARMTFGISTCLILSIFEMPVYYYALHDARFEELLPIFGPLIGTFMAYALLQPIIWWLGPGGFICTASFLVGVPLLWNIGVVSTDFILGPDETLLILTETSAYPWLYIIPLFVGSAYLIGVAGIAVHRKGQFSDLRMPTLSRKSAVSLESVRNETFSSPEEALRWLEFRQHWKLFPWLSGVLFFGWFFLKFFDRVTLASVLEAMQWSALIALALAGFFCSMPGDSPKTNRGPSCSTSPRRPWN